MCLKNCYKGIPRSRRSCCRAASLYMSRINRSCRMVRWVSEVSGGEVSTGDTTHSVVVPRSAENDNLF